MPIWTGRRPSAGLDGCLACRQDGHGRSGEALRANLSGRLATQAVAEDPMNGASYAARR